MIDERELFDRAFELFEMPEPAFERLVVRRDRKRRNERLAAGIAALAIIVAVGAIFGRAWFSSAPVPLDEPKPDSTSIEPAHFATLTQSERRCTLDLGKEPLTAGVGSFTVVNESDTLVSFSFFLLPNLTFEEFEAAVRNERRLAEEGKPYNGLPRSADPLFDPIEVRPGESVTFDAVLSAGTYAVVCLHKYEGVGMRPFDLVGPFVVTGSL